MKQSLVSIVTLGLALTTDVTAQGVSTRYDPAVPTGMPIAANYTDQLRPQVHYTPPKGFMNDPNGMFRDKNNTWHYYYQFNPTGLGPGNTHWGHATSQDLYHWENQQIALFPPADNRYANTFAFTGSCVVDTNNTSGFFPSQDNGVVAIFTLGTVLADGNGGPQTQEIAYSRDGGYTFELYNGNPVLDIGNDQFRDPKVIWYEDHWVMVLALSHEYIVQFYTSPDLKNWTFASNFTHQGLFGTQYECPNLVPIPARDDEGNKVADMWLLLVSFQPGAPLGGSASQYFPGFFNGTHFTKVDDGTRILDFAKDNYAGQYFYGLGPDEDAVMIGWASNWQYCSSTPTAADGWRSVATTARRQYLTNVTRIGWKLVNEPYDLSPVLGDILADESFNGTSDRSFSVDFRNVSSNSLYWEANVTNINSTQLDTFSTANFTFISPNSGELIRTGYFFSGDTPFFIDRGQTHGLSDNIFFTDRFSDADITNGTYWSVSGILDRSILEVFVDKGSRSGTSVYFPNEPLTLMHAAFNGLGDAQISFRVYGLNSAWAPYEDENGTVRGNVTSVTANCTAGMAMPTASMSKRTYRYERRAF